MVEYTFGRYLVSPVFVILFLILLLPATLSGQTLRIEITDTQNNPMIGATVHLERVEDGVRTSRITDNLGQASFSGLNQGSHKLKVTYIGFEPIEESIEVNGEDLQRVRFRMREDAIALGEVTVTARRPLIRQEDDKMIIDPEPLASISTNTLEILESTPGLFVDPDGGIYLSSATPATIYINGREQKMSNQDINTILRSLPPNSIQQIEVIRTPSARYAASSSGGIINIVLKRGVRIGRFGSVNSGANQGHYGNRFAGLSLNNGGDRVTSYINLNYSNNNGLEELNTARLLQPDTTLMQSARTRRNSNQAFVGYGLNFDATERLNISYDGRINGSLPSTNSSNTNLINANGSERINHFDYLVDNDSRFLNIQQDFGIRLNLDTLGSDWDTRISYAFNRNYTLQNYQNTGIFPVSEVMMTGQGDNNQMRHFVQLQSDLSWQLPWKINLETGVSTSFQDYNSDADYRVTIQENEFHDPLRTQAFNYQENINAAYLQFSRTLGWEVLLKTGVRFEHTFMQGNQTIPADTSFVVDRSDWFPYLYLSRPLFTIEGFEIRSFLIYRRTISRPGYQSLNPWVNYVDQFLYEVGNPALKPQFTNNMEMNVSLDDMPIFAVGRSYTTDIFSNVIYSDERDERIAVRTYDNLGSSRETYFRGIVGIPPVNRYFFAVGAQYNLNEYEGFYEGTPLSYTRGSWRFFTFHMFRITNNTRLAMSGFMMTGGQFNFLELGTFGQLNLSLNQTFLDRRLTVSISARDVLRTMVTDFELNQGTIRTSGSRYMDNQRFGISIRYNFGIPNRNERRDNNMFRFDSDD